VSHPHDRLPPHGGPLHGLTGLGELVDDIRRHLRSRLWLQIVAGMVLGVGVGLLLSPADTGLVSEGTGDRIAEWLSLPGHVFLALIQMMVIPLVVTSIVLGIAANEDLPTLRRLGLRIAPYFVVTTLVAVVIGIVAAYVVSPGRYVDSDLVRATLGTGAQAAAPGESLEDASLPTRIVELVPTNPISAAVEKSMLQLVVFSILVGIALLSIDRRRARPVLELSSSIQELSMKVVSWAMAMAPVAVFGLIAQITLQVGLEALVGVSVYVATVLGGLATLLALYLAIVALLARRSPFRFLAAVREAMLLAFSTSSSAAVMPLSIETAEKKLGVPAAVSQFVIPLGATVNMAGTALYQAVAAVFLAQVFAVDLTMGQLVMLTLTTVGASIGSPSTPGVGIVILATILAGIGVPASGVALIIGVDRILDMSRTAVNVVGDLVGCVLVQGTDVGSRPPEAVSAG